MHLLMADCSSLVKITCGTAAPDSKCSAAFAQMGGLCGFCLAETTFAGVDCTAKQFDNAAYMQQLQQQD